MLRSRWKWQTYVKLKCGKAAVVGQMTLIYNGQVGGLMIESWQEDSDR